MSTPDYNALLEPLIQLSHRAGEAIMKVHRTDFEVEQKEDDSPLTLADRASHELIEAGLAALTPDWPILSEESAETDAFEVRREWTRYWLVDPLDGTREFVKGGDDFTVNIALVENHQVQIGVVYVPVTGVTYYAAKGVGAFKKSSPDAEAQQIQVRPTPENALTMVGSRSHSNEATAAFIERLRAAVDSLEVSSIGSSLKFCLVAEGEADLYPRFGLTSEWDTAAAQCIVEVAGGQVTEMNFQPLEYNRKDSLLNPHFLVFSHRLPVWENCLEPA